MDELLTQEIKQSIKNYFTLLKEDVIIAADLAEDEKSQQVAEFLAEIAALSPKISITEAHLDRRPSFTLRRGDQGSGIVFAGIPLGEEMNSFILALLQVAGHPPKIPPQQKAEIQSLTAELHFTTYVSLTCKNCPTVVQALNIMAVLNPRISHTMVDGDFFTQEADAKEIIAVPTIYLNGREFAAGRMTLGEILAKLAPKNEQKKTIWDVVVIGGGPSGCSGAYHASLAGLKTTLVAPEIGGHLLGLGEITDLIGTPHTSGTRLAKQLAGQLKRARVNILNDQVTGINKKESFHVRLANGETLNTRCIVIATGCKPVIPPILAMNSAPSIHYNLRETNLARKEVGILGGGCQGVTTAIEIAKITKSVTIMEQQIKLTAPDTLQEKVKRLPNVEVLTAQQVTSVNILNDQVQLTMNKRPAPLLFDELLVYCGQTAATEPFKTVVAMDSATQILINEEYQTDQAGIFAIGECTISPTSGLISYLATGQKLRPFLQAYLAKK